MPRRTGSAQPHTGASLHTPDGGARTALRPAAGRRLSLLAVVVVFSLGPSLVTAANPVPSWTIIGAKQISKAAASWTSVAVDVNNAPCVAYSDSLTNLTVRRYFGPDAGWRNLGPSSIHPGTSTYLSLAQAPGGVNHVAYRGNSGKITVLKYNFQKNIWTELGPPRFSPGGASFISLAFDSKGTAFVIYSDEALGKRATVQKFDGTKWVLVGPRGLSAGAATDTRIAIGPNDVPVIAYADATKGGRATVRKLSGASWPLLGPMGFTTNKVSSIVLRINSLNRPVIGYIDYAPASPTKPKATASRWTGTAWTKLPTAGTVATASLPRNAVSLSLDSAGVPYLVFSDGATGVNGKFTMKKYTSGIAWTPVGKTGPIGGYARFLDVAVDNDDAPVVVFSDAAALNKTTVASWKNPLMSFMALGDWGRGGNAPQKATAALMAGAAGRGLIPEFIISTGDNFYPSGLTSANDPQFASSFKNVYSAPALKNIQWELVLGNHDNCDGAVGCPNCKNSPSFQLSDNIAKLDPRFRAHRTSFLEDLGGGKIAIFFIDTSPFIKQYRTTSWSKCPGGIQTQNNAANLALLDSLLANSFATWKIVIGHHPPNSNGAHGNNPDIIAAIEPILTKHKVQAYFAGHDHNLEHLRKKVTSTYTYDTIVTGGGSSLSGGPKGTANSLKFLPANGFAWASFFDDELLVDFYTVQGGNSSSPTYTARIPRKP